MQADGDKIRRQREQSGYGLNAFARKVGVSPSWLSRIERNQVKDPSLEVLARIATGLKRALAEQGEQMAKARAVVADIARQDTRGNDESA